MITAVDTSALVAIDRGEPDAEAWIDCLAEARRAGALVIGEIVAAEFFAVVMDRGAFDTTLEDLGIEVVPSSVEAACLAGATFRKYREAGGPRENLVPDFLIAAQAQIDCGALAAADRGYYRRYFTGLRVVRPV